MDCRLLRRQSRQAESKECQNRQDETEEDSNVDESLAETEERFRCSIVFRRVTLVEKCEIAGTISPITPCIMGRALFIHVN